MQNIIKGRLKPKPHIQMTIKGPSRKQVIILINENNTTNFMKESSQHVSNINRILKNAKSNVLVNFIQSDQSGITVVTCKVTFPSDLQLIKNYIKNIKYIDAAGVDVPCLPQSKSYLKIIDILYYPHDDPSICLSSNNIKVIIKQNQIFDNVILTSKPYVIKVSPKSDMSIVWVDIWNVQSGSKAKGLINWCFNVGSHTTTIRGANMNLSMPSARTVGGGVMQLSHAGFKEQDMSSAVVCIKPNIINSLGSIVK